VNSKADGSPLWNCHITEPVLAGTQNGWVEEMFDDKALNDCAKYRCN